MCHTRAHSRFVYLGMNARDTAKWVITWKTFEAFKPNYDSNEQIETL